MFKNTELKTFKPVLEIIVDAIEKLIKKSYFSEKNIKKNDNRKNEYNK